MEHAIGVTPVGTGGHMDWDLEEISTGTFWERNCAGRLSRRERVGVVRAAVVCSAVLRQEARRTGGGLDGESAFLAEYEDARDTLEPDAPGAISGRLLAARSVRLAAASGPAVLRSLAGDVATLESLVGGGDRALPVPTSALATQFWRGIGNVCRALDPELPRRERFSATAFNPEAGDHPVPQVRAELAACLAVSRRLVAEVPELARFGRRGFAFIVSDGLWLASLREAQAAGVVISDSEVKWQLDWLRGFLDRAGCPLVWLERWIALAAEEWSASRLGASEHWTRLARLCAELGNATQAPAAEARPGSGCAIE